MATYWLDGMEGFNKPLPEPGVPKDAKQGNATTDKLKKNTSTNNSNLVS